MCWNRSRTVTTKFSVLWHDQHCYYFVYSYVIVCTATLASSNIRFLFSFLPISFEEFDNKCNEIYTWMVSLNVFQQFHSWYGYLTHSAIKVARIIVQGHKSNMNLSLLMRKTDSKLRPWNLLILISNVYLTFNTFITSNNKCKAKFTIKELCS